MGAHGWRCLCCGLCFVDGLIYCSYCFVDLKGQKDGDGRWAGLDWSEVNGVVLCSSFRLDINNKVRMI